MSRFEEKTLPKSQKVMDGLYHAMTRRLEVNPNGLCPVDMSLNIVRMCNAESCGKCTPCRVGLAQLGNLIEKVLDGKASMETLDLIEETAEAIVATADCVIGIDAAKMVLVGLLGFRDDYEEHIRNGRCISNHKMPVPCVENCPSNVDIPGYMALVKAGRNADAVRLIRKDNPFVSACALVCEHPCESKCRRSMVDAPVNIRGLKRYAFENAGVVPQPECAESTGKKIAVIGGGPSGLSCAYYLSLMGHKVTLFDSKKKLGGMLRYGIPNYRLPREILDAEIESILSTGIEVRTETFIGRDITMDELRNNYDSTYISIGAHNDKKLGLDNENSKNVISAVEMLRNIGDDNMPDFKGRNVVVVGGGNVAMDVTRTSIRLGAKSVTCAYRRRIEDMTALPEEVEGAMAEGAEIRQLMAPVRVEANENGECAALWVQPQIIGPIDKSGRPRPVKAELPEVRIPADIIIVAIGQAIDSKPFEDEGFETNRGTFITDDRSRTRYPEVFAGGDCVTGPASAIKAIAAGKAAAARIDEQLGFCHEISVDVEIPTPELSPAVPHGRINTSERDAGERKNDFEDIECGMTCQGACTEASRCLRCDHYGYGSFRGGRQFKW